MEIAGHDGGSALHCAAWQGSASTVALLLTHPSAATLLTTNDAHYRQPPLGWCCHGSLNGPRHGEHARVAELLLEAGAPPLVFDASSAVEAVVASWVSDA